MEDNEVNVHECDIDTSISLPQEEEEELGEVEEEIGATEGSRTQIQTSYIFKLTVILKNLHSQELKIYSDASEEFIYLLRGDSGGDILREYVQLSTKCSELLEAWRLHKGKPGMSYILSVISVMLSHPCGRSRLAATRISLDSFARSVLEDKLEDVYAELNSQQWRRQSAALSLLASIVKRRMGLSSEVAKRFDFKLPVLSKLSGAHNKKAGKDFKLGKSRSTRKAFVEFAMSFLEVGNPRLLRWILQQRDMYFGVLSGLANDDADTVILVLSTLRDKVLTEGSLVPPALRSVLFGRVTLEQLSLISGNPVAGHAADIAHEVLVMVCTDPQNGLMQGPGLKGNQKRLLELMRKLKATEVRYHKKLLLAIVKGRENFCSAYMDEFPYYLEPHPSSSWFSAISLAADLISSIDTGLAITNMASHSCDQLVENTRELHGILKCIIPRSFSRSAINKGLLHSESLVKHGSLRLVLESLKSLDSLISSIDNMIERSIVIRKLDSYWERMATLHNPPGLNFLVHVDKNISDSGNVSSPSAKVRIQDWVALKHYVQNEIRADLPDPQVLLKLLSTSSAKYSSIGVKRAAIFPETGMKKLKSNKVSENVDIFIGGLDTLQTDDAYVDFTKATSSNQDIEAEKDHFNIVSEIWGLNEKTTFGNKPEDVDNFFHSKLLDVLKFYLRTVPIAFEGSLDFFKFLPANPSSLSIDQQQSLLSLLVECYRQCIGKRQSAGAPESMYKHLHPLINFLKFSQVKDTEGDAYTLVRAAMVSTGAFDQNISEIDAWFVFLPGCIKNVGESKDMEAFRKQSAIIISFLCDAVSTIGNNLYKHLHQMRELVSEFDDVEDHSVCFSPLIICILKKCLRLLASDSVTFKLYEKSMISLYVGNTLRLILSTQVDMRMLSCLIHKLLCEQFKDNSSVDEDSKSFPCEWRPLKNLFGFVSHMLDKRLCVLHPISDYSIDKSQSSFPSVLFNIEELVKHAQGASVDGLARAFTASILCTAPDDIMSNFPSVLAIILEYFPSHLPFLTSVLFQNHKLLFNIRELWPKIFCSGLELISQAVNCSHGGDAGYFLLSYGVSLSIDSSILAANFASTEFAASAFCSFLMNSPFYALFSATLSFATLESHLDRFLNVFPSKMLKLLQLKVSEGSIDESILFLKYVLFWTYHMILLYKEKPSFIISELLQMCITLVQNLMDRLQAVICKQSGLKTMRLSSVGKYSQVIAELIFGHPLVTLCISNPLYFSREFTNETQGNSVYSLLTSLKQHAHPMDHCILQLLRKFFNYYLVLCSDHSSSETHNAVCTPFVRIQKRLIEKILLSFREKFEHCVIHKNAGPFLHIFYIFQSLMGFISPFDLLELVHWIFCKIENISDCTSLNEYAVSVGFYVADGSLDMLCRLLQEPRLDYKADLSLDESIKSFDAYLVPKIFYRILDFALCFNQEQGEICMLKVVNAVYSQRCAKPSSAFLPLHVLLSSLIFNCPEKLLRYCLYSTSKIKAKILLQLTEISSVHMSLFGNIFLVIIGYSQSTMSISNFGCILPCKSKVTSESKYCFSNEDFLLLLPVALSYFISSLHKHGEPGLQSSMKIPILYSSILLDGFSNWNVFVSKEIFQEDYDEFTTISLEEFNSFFSRSLIGKAVVMLHYFFVLTGNSIRKKVRLNLFDSVCPQSSFFDGVLCSGATGLGGCSYKESLKVIIEVAAKISFMRLLLSPNCSIQSLPASVESVEDMPTKTESNLVSNAKLRFMTTLFNTLDQIFKQFPLKVDSSAARCATNCYCVFRILEHVILTEIVSLSKEMHIEITYFPSVNHFIRSSLLHRFEDPVTIKSIRCILVALSESNFSFGDVLELLIGHSAFVKIILCDFAICDSSVFSTCGALLQPLTSVLKLIDVSHSLESVPKKSSPTDSSSKMNSDYYYVQDVKLELVRLLRILFHFKDRNLRMNSFNSKELLSLLLCGYGATLSQIDLEIFHLMHEILSIEGPDNVSMAALDYMWGSAALKMREEKAHDIFLPSNFIPDSKTIEERKILFRESIPVDSKVCAVTVLHCCTDRSSTVAPASLDSLLKDTSVNAPKIMTSSGKNIIEPYDPSFILQFSIHTLLMGYLEPLEFSRIGLLAVTFASISSPDEAVRKLGYECLGRFSKCLESCQKSKDLLHLQLLLSYIQNGITEAWQKIPTVIAIFAAEASLELLDHSQIHFLTISKFLMRLPRMNLKEIPLFHAFFGSSSIHFRTNRLWILRLLHAGLNLPDDAKLYLRNNILILLLNYSASSLADTEFKILTLMIIKKYVKMLDHHLVKESGLLPWLSSLLLFYGGRLIEHQEHSSVEVLKLILEVATVMLSSSPISEWMQECALEQLSELSSHILKLFVGAVKLLKQDISLINAMLTVIASTVRLSQKRKIYQPHFTLSIECLFQLFQAVSDELSSMGYTIELGMHVILLNTPTPVTSNVDKARLMKLLTWAIPSACWSNHNKRYLTKNLNSYLILHSEKDQTEESLASKLLRWTVASVILGSVLSNLIEIQTSSLSGKESLLAYLKGISIDTCEVTENSSVNDSLAILILHLRGLHRSVLPSMVSALCVLLLKATSISSGKLKKYLDENCDAIQTRCSKIRFPTEANSAWRWSFDQPWQDPSLNRSEVELMEEEHACQSLLVIFSNAVGVGESQGFPALSLQDVENSGPFDRERGHS